MNIGIVGHEASKFTEAGEREARAVIWQLLLLPCTMVSGGCHLGGIDIWAEEEADKQGRPKIIHLPTHRRWRPNGFEERNLRIARDSHELHCIAVRVLAPAYRGMKFDHCYHCDRDDHVKGGGCWTMKKAKAMGRKTVLHIVENGP